MTKVSNSGAPELTSGLVALTERIEPDPGPEPVTVEHTALERLASQTGPPSRVLICGSLYLAGLVLREDAA